MPELYHQLLFRTSVIKRWPVLLFVLSCYVQLNSFKTPIFPLFFDLYCKQAILRNRRSSRMKNVLLFSLLFASSFAHAGSTKKLICEVSYVTIAADGHRIMPVLEGSHVEEDFEETSDLGSYASILKRTKDNVDLSATVTGDQLMASLSYGKQQTSYEGPIAEGGFHLTLFYRGGDVLINGR